MLFARDESLISFVAKRRNLVTAQRCPSRPLNDDPGRGGNHFSHVGLSKTNEEDALQMQMREWV